MLGRVLAAALTALIAVAAADAATVDDLTPGSVYEVRAVRVQGAKAVPRRAVRDVMLTRAPAWYTPWRPHQTFNATLFRSDLERVRVLLRESGCSQARVSHDL